MRDSAELARTIEALLFLSSDPLTGEQLAQATQSDEQAVAGALARLHERPGAYRS